MNEFQEELSGFADNIEITDGSATTAQGRARSRQRKAVAARLGAVVIIAGAGVGGIRALSSTGLDGDPIDQVASGSAVPTATSDPGQAATSLVDGESAGTSGDEIEEYPTDDWLASAPETRPASLTELNYTWTAYADGSPEALALRFDPNEQYAVGTADGAAGDPYAYAVYAKTDNGWEAVEEFKSNSRPVLVGDTVYVTPFSEDDTPPTELRAFDIASGAWSDIALPDAVTALPSADSAVTAYHYPTLSGTADRLVMLDFASYEIDSDAIGLSGKDVYVNNNGSELEIGAIDRACAADAEQWMMEQDPKASVPTTPPGTSPVSVEPVSTDPGSTDPVSTGSAVPTAAPFSKRPPSETTVPQADASLVTEGTYVDPYAECTQKLSIDDLGLSDSEQAMLEAPSYSLWSYDGAQWNPIGPLEDDVSINLYESGIVTSADEVYDEANNSMDIGQTHLFQVQPDGTLKPLFGGNGFVEGAPVSVSGNRATFATGNYIVSTDLDTGEWRATDLGSLGPVPDWGRYSLTLWQADESADGGAVATGSITKNLPTEPMELTSGQYTLRFPAMGPDQDDGYPTLVDNSTGEEIDDYGFSTESGKVEVTQWTEDSDDPTTLATFDTDWTDVPWLTYQYDDAVFVSADGTAFGALSGEDLAQSTGIEIGDNEEIRAFSATQQGDQVLIPITVSDMYGDGGDEVRYTIVGTPK